MSHPCPPLETFGHIIDLLHEKSETLREYSLASKVPHTASRGQVPSRKTPQFMDEIPPRPFRLSCLSYPHLIYFAARRRVPRWAVRFNSFLTLQLELTIPENFDKPEISRLIPRIFTHPQVTPRGLSSPLPTSFRPHLFLPPAQS